MEILLIIVIGFLSAFFGVLPPGMLNMTVAKISTQIGKSHAIKFALGASLIVFLQSFVGVYFARYLKTHPGIDGQLRIFGAVIFVLLTAYFLYAGIKSKTNKQTKVKVKRGRLYFLQGTSLSALNVFPVPYYAFVGLTLVSKTSNNAILSSVLYFSIAATSGSFLVFYLYIILFQKLEDKLQFITKNINFFIAFITGTVALVSLYELFLGK